MASGNSLLALARPKSWWQQAACRGAGEEIFYPPQGGDFIKSYAEARRLCGMCPVRQTCLDEALRVENALGGGHNCVGMRGGLTAVEREKIVKAMPNPPRRCVNCQEYFVPSVITQRRCKATCRTYDDGGAFGEPPRKSRQAS